MRGEVLSLTAVLVFCGNLTTAQEGFFDDFDGESPVTWSPIGSGDISIDGGDMLASGNHRLYGRSFSGARVEERRFSDVSLRTQVRLINGGWIALTVRDDSQPLTTQYLGVLNVGGTVGVGRLAPDDTQMAVQGMPTDLNPYEDTILQIDAIGDKISFWAWRPEEMMPSEPLFSFHDTFIEEGIVTVNFGSLADEEVSGVLRFVQIDTVSIPEPSTLALSALGIAVLLGNVRRRGHENRLMGPPYSV